MIPSLACLPGDIPMSLFPAFKILPRMPLASFTEQVTFHGMVSKSHWHSWKWNGWQTLQCKLWNLVILPCGFSPLNASLPWDTLTARSDRKDWSMRLAICSTAWIQSIDVQTLGYGVMPQRRVVHLPFLQLSLKKLGNAHVFICIAWACPSRVLHFEAIGIKRADLTGAPCPKEAEESHWSSNPLSDKHPGTDNGKVWSTAGSKLLASGLPGWYRSEGMNCHGRWAGGWPGPCYHRWKESWE